MPARASVAVFAAFLLAAATAASAQAQRPEVVYEPTPHETVERMLRLARVGASDYVIDLGSGDGRIPIAAARSGARALGIELDAALIQKSRAGAQAAGVAGRVTFRQEDLFQTPLGEATVVTLFLLPEMNVRLRPRLLALRPGTRIVANRFAIGDWKADETDDDGARVFLWYVPASVGGRWIVRHSAQSFALDLQQRYQEIFGTATFGGAMQPLREPRLRGAEIEFTVNLDGRPTRFRGTVAGNVMKARQTGGFALEAAASDWSANRQ